VIFLEEIKKEIKEDAKKETYEKPEIRTEEIELFAYGQYEALPIPELAPFFNLCPPCSP